MKASSGNYGRCWVFGDDINTDFLAPGKYMKLGIDAIAAHCLEDVEPTFAGQVRAGDVIIGGSNFGAGSSREQAVEVLRYLKVSCVIARSFAGLFYRNGFNLGLPLFIGPQVGATPNWGISNGELASLDMAQAQLQLAMPPRILACAPIPGHLLALIDDGGLVPHLHKRLARERALLREESTE